MPGLRVPARTSSFLFKGQTEDIKKIGRLLRVGTVLEGSVQRSGNQLRVTTQLIDVANGFQLWTEKYDREMTNIFDIQDDIARNIVAKLKLSLAESGGLHNPGPHIENIEAYTLYLKGKFHADNYAEPELRQAIAHFEEALTLEPGYARAYAGLAYTYGNLRYFGFVSPESVTPQFRAAISKALALDNTLADAHFSQTQLRYNTDWDWSESERAFKRALKLDPTHVGAHGLYAFLLVTMGRHSEAMAEANQAQQLDPLSVNANVHLGWMYFLENDYDRALEIGRQCIAMDPNFNNAHVLTSYTLFRMGEPKAGIEAMEKVAQMGYFPQALGELGRMYGLEGRTADAQKILNNLLAHSEEQYVPAVAIANIYDGLAEFEQANTWMNKAITNREGSLVLLEVDFANRTNPYFSAWLEKIGLNK